MQKEFPILYETLSPQSNGGTREAVAIHEEAYTLLCNYLLKENMAKTAQPNLIVGEAGSGKTFLLKRLADNIDRNMGNSLYPILMEGKSLFSTEDIWAQCASHLNVGQGKDAFEYILEWQEDNSKRIVLLIDNIQYYFKRTDNAEQYGLRGKLNKAGSPILIASSDKVLPAFTEYEAAFFDGFKIIYLKPLPTTTIKEITDGQYDISRIERLMSYMPKTIRSLIIVTRIISKSKAAEDDLTLLSDYFYSHYQETFDSVPTQTQRILSALAHSDVGLSLSEIREITGQENGKISPYLKLMVDQKMINKESKTLRSGVYSITDPLFKLWLRQM